jgi:PAS domain S-box-containing protein
MRGPLSTDHYYWIVEYAPMLVWRAGLDTKFDYVNQTWLSFTGRTFEQEMGDGWLDAVHPDDRERCHSLYLERFEKRLPWEKEFRLRRHDGVYRYVIERGGPYMDEAGEFAVASAVPSTCTSARSSIGRGPAFSR